MWPPYVFRDGVSVTEAIWEPQVHIVGVCNSSTLRVLRKARMIGCLRETTARV